MRCLLRNGESSGRRIERIMWIKHTYRFLNLFSGLACSDHHLVFFHTLPIATMTAEKKTQIKLADGPRYPPPPMLVRKYIMGRMFSFLRYLSRHVLSGERCFSHELAVKSLGG